MASNSLDFLLNLRANAEGFNKGVDGAKFAVNALVGAMAALGLGLGVKELAEAADSYATLSARIQLATKDGGNFSQAMAGVHRVALSTNSSLDATATLFTKINDAGKILGITQQQALDLTKTINQAIKIGGGAAQASEAAVQQFTQALQSGVLRGDEFNSIMEQAPGLVQALAAGLGKTTGELRAMAENGELSAERVIKAIQSQSDEVQKNYEQFPLTISNALQKIATKWQILIGEMDQANGASATVAKWLSILADNLDIVEKLLNDIGLGFVWFGDQLKKIDPQTVEALKSALLSTYDAVKSLGTELAGSFERGIDVVNTMLAQIFNFSSGVDTATDKTNGFTKALQALSVFFGFISDGFKGVNIGFNLITGAAYDAAAAFSYWKSKITFGDTSTQALKDFEVMSAKAQEYYKKSADGAMEFKSSGVEAIRQIGLTQDEKNAERVANNAKTLADLKAQEAQHVTDYKAISDERIKLQQQLVDARKAGDKDAETAALAGLAEIDKKEKAYQAESKKISDEKIKATQDWATAQVDAATKGGVALSENSKKSIEAGVAAQGLAVEFDKTGQAIVKAIAEKAGSAVVSLDTRLAQARKGAAALGIDIDVALNKVSEGFTANVTSLDNFTKNLELMGVKGQQASDVVYLGWSKLLEKAKSQAEIDVAKAKFQEFQDKGVFSTKQVELGMLAIKQATAKLPDDLDEVGKAFERLGVKTKEQLKLAADSAIADFNTMKASGQATSEGLKQAYERVMQAAAASGNQAVIASAKAQGASVGLQAQIDETGKASVKSIDELNDSVDRVGRTARGSAADGFRELGRVAKQEAEDVAETWEQAMARVDKERKAQSASNSKGLSELQGGIDQMAEDYYKRLVAAGMDASQARSKADKAKYSLAVETTNSLKGGTTLGLNTTKQEMEKTLAYWENKNSSNAGGGSISTGGNSKAPAISAPNISTPTPNITSSSDPKNVRLEIAIGNSSTELYGTQDQVNATEALFRELEQAKKAM